MKCLDSRRDLLTREIADTQQHVMQPVHAARAAILVDRLELPLERVEHVGVEQLAQLGVAEQLPELRVIDRQRLRAALGQRRIAVVQERGHV